MRKKLLLFFAFFAILFSSYATHIVGGNLTYEHLGGATYRVNLRLYKDCRTSYMVIDTTFNGDGTINSIDTTVIVPVNFPTNVTIEVRNGDGVLPGCNDEALNFSMPRVGRDTLDPHIDTCAFNPGVCVEEALFSKVVVLPHRVGGYHMFYRTYARNYTLINLVNNTASGDGSSDLAGEAFNTYIPDMTSLLTNSSPVFAKFPPVYVCTDQDLNFNNSATDVDGDSLVYSLYQPYQGRPEGAGTPDFDCNTDGSGDYLFFPEINNSGTPPNNITFPTVAYEPGFDPLNCLNPVAFGSPLSITSDGILNGIPQIQGQFVVAIKVEEYRDGVKIGEIVRDFQFNVLVCPPLKGAGIEPVVGCNDTEVQMINGSDAGAEDFTWDFDPSSPGTVTSTLENPTHDFGGIGDYPIMLIAQTGTSCADTAYYTVPISGVTADFNAIDSACVENLVNFTDASTTTANATVNSWLYHFGDGDSSLAQNTSHEYEIGSDYSVQLIAGNDLGCYDTISRDLYIQSLPTVVLGPDTTACFNNPLINLSGAVANAGGGLWTGSGGVFTPGASFLNVSYTPAQPELDLGSSELILYSTNNGYCPEATDTIRIVYIDGPDVDAGPNQLVCKDSSSIQLNGTFQFSGGIGWYTENGTGTFDDTSLVSPVYFPSDADTALGQIIIYAQTTINGNCFPSTDSMILSFFDLPTVNIGALDTVCADNNVFLESNSTTTNGFWETLGDGTFMPSDTGLVATYDHGIADSTAGFVDLVFHSLENGGCKVVRDTHRLEILPAPDVNFDFSLECLNEETSLTDQTVSSEPIVSWAWTFEPGQTSSQENPSYTFSNPGETSVELIVTTLNGCTDTLVKDVTVHFLPVAHFGPETLCLEGGTQFIDSSSVDSASIVAWDWSFSDGTTDDVEDPLHFFPSAGDYDVELVVESEFGCLDSVTYTFGILPGPTAGFTFAPSSAYVFETVQFTDQSTGDITISDWDWNFGDTVGVSTEQNPIYNFGDKGTYTVTLIIQDAAGCVDTVQKDINIYLPPLVPNAFSPDGNSNNDVLYVYGGPFTELEFKIYNNWGEIIFTSNDQSNGWNGDFKGTPQPIGNYVYTVTAKTKDDKVHTLSGDVQITR